MFIHDIDTSLLHIFAFLNILASGKCGSNFKSIISYSLCRLFAWPPAEKMSAGESHKNLNSEQSALVQLMAWCRQATGHYTSQCWASSMTSYEPQCTQTNIAPKERVFPYCLGCSPGVHNAPYPSSAHCTTPSGLHSCSGPCWEGIRSNAGMAYVIPSRARLDYIYSSSRTVSLYLRWNRLHTVI